MAAKSRAYPTDRESEIRDYLKLAGLPGEEALVHYYMDLGLKPATVRHRLLSTITTIQ